MSDGWRSRIQVVSAIVFSTIEGGVIRVRCVMTAKDIS